MAGAVFLAGGQAAQLVLQESIQGFLDIALPAKNFDTRLGEFLLSALPHAAGDNMSDLVSQYLINRQTAPAAVDRPVGNGPPAGDLLLFRVDIDQKKVLALPEMGADIAMDTGRVLQYYSNLHSLCLPFRVSV